MFGLAIEKGNGTADRRLQYMSRLTAVLHDGDGIAADIACGDVASPAAETGPVDGVRTHGNRLEEAARQIAEALSWTLSEGVQEIGKQAAKDQARLDSTTETLAGLSAEFGQIKTQLAGLQETVESQTPQWSGLNATLALFDNRLRRGETDLLGAEERIVELSTGQVRNELQIQTCALAIASLEARLTGLGERFNETDQRLDQHAEVACRLRSVCERLEQVQASLDARLGPQEQTIRELQTEVRRRGGLMDGLLGSLRSLEGRREHRYLLDKPVKIGPAGPGETAIAGRVVNAAKGGLGLTLDAPAAVNSELRVDTGDEALCGQVVYCNPAGNGYAVGVKLAAAS